MNITLSPLERSVRAADLPLDQLAANTHVSKQEKIGEASRQFEAMLLRQILSDAQKPLFSSALLGESTAQGIYRDMVVRQLADSISESGSFGLAKLLEQDLTGQFTAEDPAEAAQAGNPRSIKTYDR